MFVDEISKLYGDPVGVERLITCIFGLHPFKKPFINKILSITLHRDYN